MHPVVIPANEVASDARQVVLGADQAEYQGLPATMTSDGNVVVTRWQFTDGERVAILNGAGIDMIHLPMGHPFQPIMPSVQGVEPEGEWDPS